MNKVGLPIPPDFEPSTLAERWRWGQGSMRAEVFEPEPFTAVAMHRETMVYATRGGLVRAVDIDSGEVVGDYYKSAHSPQYTGIALYFDSQVVALGDESGSLLVWRARLPGAWGFVHSPSWELSSAPGQPAHQSSVTGIVVVGDRDRRLVSSDEEGNVVFWSPLRHDKEVLPESTATAVVPIHCLCAAVPLGEEDDDMPGVYAGTSSGELVLFQATDGDPQVKVVLQLEENITAIAFDEQSGKYVLGTAAGRVYHWSGGTKDPVEFPAFHENESAVRSLSVVHAQEEGSQPGETFLVSADSTGRVGVWDLESRTPRWGLTGLNGNFMVTAADSGRLVTSGVVFNDDPDRPGFHPTRMSRMPRWSGYGIGEERQVVQGLFIMDMRPGAKEEKEEPYWPESGVPEPDMHLA